MIRTHQVNAILHIALSGRLSLSALYELTAILIQVTDSCEEYCLDMSKVVTISDGALAALVMFIRRARRMGRHTRLTGCHRRFSCRLAAIPALHGQFEHTTHTRTMPQRRWIAKTACQQHNSVAAHTSDYHYHHPDLLPGGTGREADKITRH